MHMKARFFKTQHDFRKWLEKNHLKEKELIVGFYKVDSGKPSMTWPESVDQALCYGWIDSIRRSIDKDSYCIRFTPRKSTSIWSKVNIQKVENLIEQGLMTPEGLELYKQRKEHRSGIYSFESAEKELPENYLNLFTKNKKAWQFFHQQTASYKKTLIHWVISAKQETTRLKRLNTLITESAKGNKLFDNYR